MRERLGYLRQAFQGDWYAVRRGAIAPEAPYKRRLLRRIQRCFGITTLVETGAFRGDTPAFLHADFERIYSIELSADLYALAKDRLARFPNVEVLQGDSGELLPGVIQGLTSPALFWLDGHYSSGETAGAAEENPILRELAAIAFSDARPHIVAIDDASDFSSAASKCTLSQVVAAAEHLGRGYRIYFDYDILLALPDYGPSTDFWRHIAAPLVIR